MATAATQWDSFASLLADDLLPVNDGCTPNEVGADLFDAALMFLDVDHDDSSDHTSHSDSEGSLKVDDSPVHWDVHDKTSTTYAAADRGSLQVKLKFAAINSDPALVNFGDAQPVMPTQEMAAEMATWCAPPPPAKPVTARRNKRREEIERLKVEVQQLQTRLQKMQLTATSEVQQDSEQAWVGEVLGSAWQNVAAGQRQRLQVSEAENRKLKNMIFEQKRLAKALRRLLNRQADAKEWDDVLPRQSPPISRTLSQYDPVFDDPGLFDSLAAALFPMYLQTDSMLSDPELATLTSSYRSFRTEGTAPDSMAVHHLDARVVPSDVGTTADAMWQHFMKIGNKKGYYKWEQVSENTFQAEFIGYTELGEYKGTTRAKMVVRRIVESHRVVILRSSMFCCADGGISRECPFLKLPMRHLLWSTIERPRHPKLRNLKKGMAQVHMADMSMPRLDETTFTCDDRDSEWARLVDVCLSISRYQADKSHEVVDNLLLERMLAGPDTDPDEVVYEPLSV